MIHKGGAPSEGGLLASTGNEYPPSRRMGTSGVPWQWSHDRMTP